MIDDMRADDWLILDETTRLVGENVVSKFRLQHATLLPEAGHNPTRFVRAQYRRQAQQRETLNDLAEDTIATALDAVRFHTIYVGKRMNNDLPGPYLGWDV